MEAIGPDENGHYWTLAVDASAGEGKESFGMVRCEKPKSVLLTLIDEIRELVAKG